MDVSSIPLLQVVNGVTHVVIEPFYGGSHKQLLDGLLKSFFPENSALLLTLPAKKWKWYASRYFAFVFIQFAANVY